MDKILENETVKFIIKKHWIMHFILIWRLIKYFILPILVIEFLFFWIFIEEIKSKIALINLVFVLYYLIIALIVFLFDWLDNDLNIMIVTNKRVIAYLQLNSFHRCTTTAYLWKIQDIKWERNWCLANILNYWDLSIYTSNYSWPFDFCINHVNDPENAAEKILNHINDVKKQDHLHNAMIEDEIDEIHKQNETTKITELLKDRVSDIKPNNDCKIKKFFKERVVPLLKRRTK